MPNDPREDFERRLLALVRNEMDGIDEDHPHGWEITDFVVTARYYGAPKEAVELFPWDGGPYPGWQVNGFTCGSSPAFFLDAQLLEEGLEVTLRRRETLRSAIPNEGDSPES
jgi:hypothetical protein